MVLYNWLSLNLFGFFVGVVFIAAGAYLGRWSFLELNKYHTAHDLYQNPRTIVTTGPYQFSRNPIYLGLSMIYLGLGALFANLWVFFFYPFLFLWLNVVIVEKEENLLDDLFGEDFYQYRRLVRRWM